LLVWPFAFTGRKGTVRFLVRHWAWMIFLLMGKRLRISGTENIQPGRKYILLANHSSIFDITAILVFFPGISWFGREHLLRIPVFGQILRKIDYIPMTRADVRNTRVMLDQLVRKSTGLSIAMFPEGTRTLDGDVNPFRRGFIRLLKSTDLDLLPVTLTGFHSLKPKNRFWIDFGSSVGVVIHDPIPNASLRDKRTRRSLRPSARRSNQPFLSKYANPDGTEE
jgi:1-acyl-sn-glycerol-3-phosphate acyltransferase